MGRIDIKTKIEDTENPLFTGTRPDALDIIFRPRLTADCNLARCDPDFDPPLLEDPGVGSDLKPVAHRRSTTVQRSNQLALRFTPVLQLVPRSRTATFKDRVGAMGDSFLHPSHLFVAVHDPQLHFFSVLCAFLFLFLLSWLPRLIAVPCLSGEPHSSTSCLPGLRGVRIESAQTNHCYSASFTLCQPHMGPRKTIDVAAMM